MEENRDTQLTREIGRSMRFFLNLSASLIIFFAVFFLSSPHPLTTEGMMIALLPVSIALLFFVVFLRLLKTLENKAANEKNIWLVSRVIGEFNKSWVIRATIGKIQVFENEEKPKR
jgi:hypothetical protein